jgi:hypothetical protein
VCQGSGGAAEPWGSAAVGSGAVCQGSGGTAEPWGSAAVGSGAVCQGSGWTAGIMGVTVGKRFQRGCRAA